MVRFAKTAFSTVSQYIRTRVIFGFRQDIRTFAVKETTATCGGFVEKYTLKNLNYIICHKQIE
jgi:hypothetical protein